MCRSIFCLIFFVSICSPASAEDLVKLRPYARQISFTGFTRPVQELSIAPEIDENRRKIAVDLLVAKVHCHIPHHYHYSSVVGYNNYDI